MKVVLLYIVLIVFTGCSPSSEVNVGKYHELVNKAELEICAGRNERAVTFYNRAFSLIEKPFGKDVFNATLASQLSGQNKVRDDFLQLLVNNSDDLAFVKSVFVEDYISEEEWSVLISKRRVVYDIDFREEFKEMSLLDQMFRPMYDTPDDTINVIREQNVKNILAFTEHEGFPSHIELGYTEKLRGQNYNIVLHHTAQRRSRDKSVIDLEPVLFQAVVQGRFDPDMAIFYLNFQSDTDKGPFEVYSTWQYKHQLLPDSLNKRIWFPSLSDEQRTKADSMRNKWYANSLNDITIKASFLANSSLPFIFTCVQHSIANLSADLSESIALEQYYMFTSQMKEYN